MRKHENITRTLRYNALSDLCQEHCIEKIKHTVLSTIRYTANGKTLQAKIELLPQKLQAINLALSNLIPDENTYVFGDNNLATIKKHEILNEHTPN